MTREVKGRIAGASQSWRIAEETAVAFAYNGETAAVMMATPADLEDFARGFSLTEGYVASLADIAGIKIAPSVLGIVVEIALRDGVTANIAAKRSIAGRSGCGICGVDSLEAALRPPKRVEAPAAIAESAIARAFAELSAHQPLNAETHSVHAAAFATRDGEIKLAREDVGRHNALDKLIGALAASNIDASQGFIVMTSRCSYELIVKAATLRVPLLATVSAPTALALDFAYASGMTLAAHAKEGIMIFAPTATRAAAAAQSSATSNSAAAPTAAQTLAGTIPATARPASTSTAHSTSGEASRSSPKTRQPQTTRLKP